VGHEPDAYQRVDAQVSACGPIAGGRRSGTGGKRRIEVGGLAPLRRALGCPHAGVDGLGPVVVQIDGIHMTGDLVVAVIGVLARPANAA
jgi:hypothetical protein